MQATPQPPAWGLSPGQAGPPWPPHAPFTLAGIESLLLGPVKKSHWMWNKGSLPAPQLCPNLPGVVSGVGRGNSENHLLREPGGTSRHGLIPQEQTADAIGHPRARDRSLGRLSFARGGTEGQEPTLAVTVTSEVLGTFSVPAAK